MPNDSASIPTTIIPPIIANAFAMLSVTDTFFSICLCSAKNLSACSSVIAISDSILFVLYLVSHFGSSLVATLSALCTILGSSSWMFLVRTMMTQRIRKMSNVPARKAKVSIWRRT